MRSVATFRADCQACGHAFPNPLLSDFDYGECLLRGERGSAVRHLVALTEPAWDVIMELFPGPRVTPQGYPDAGRLRWVIARLADPVDGERFLMDITCPRCHSTDVDYGAGESLGTIDVPDATFERFMTLSPAERAAEVESLAREYPGDSRNRH